MGDAFYVVLPSNASHQIFKDNKLHSYKVKIPKLPFTEGKWEVGMTEIQFPSKWPNLIDAFIRIRWEQDQPSLTYHLPTGFYQNANQLLEIIQTVLNSAKINDKVEFKYDIIQNRVIMKVREGNGFGIGLSKNLTDVLGFNALKTEFYTKGVHRPSFPTDINDGLAALYVYSDICENRLVGDNMVPLLRVVPSEPTSTKQNFMWIRFWSVEYIRAVNTNSDTIEINIRRDDGDIIPFESGKVVVTLHFRKISP